MSNAKLKIGFVFDDTLDSWDGVAQYVKTLGSWYASQGHEVRYLVGETKIKEWAGGKVYSLANNFRVSFNGNKMTTPGLASKPAIKKILANENFDVLHVQVPYSPFLAGRIVKLAPKRTAVIGTFHVAPAGPLSRLGGRLLYLLLWRSLKRFDAVVSVSTAGAAYAKQTLRLKTGVIPNSVNIDNFKTSIKPKPYKVVFLGRLVQRKGCRELLYAFDKLHRLLPQAKLVIGGRGPLLPQLENYVSQRGLRESVEFMGFIDEKDKPAFLASGAIACFPAIHGESFGIVLIEAMAAGAGVVIGGNNPGYSTVLGERPDLLIDPRDSGAMAATLMRVLTDKKYASALHAWQDKTVKQYDTKRVGAQLIDLYRSVIARKPKIKHN